MKWYSSSAIVLVSGAGICCLAGILGAARLIIQPIVAACCSLLRDALRTIRPAATVRQPIRKPRLHPEPHQYLLTADTYRQQIKNKRRCAREGVLAWKGRIRLSRTWASSTLCRSSCFGIRWSSPLARPIGKRTLGSGRPGPGRRRATRFGPLPSVFICWVWSGVRRSPLSATTGRSYTGR